MQSLIDDIIKKHHMYDETKHYACIMLCDNTYVVGENYAQLNKLGSIHAEHNVLRKYARRCTPYRKTEKFDMLIFRISKTGKFGNSHPCAGCIARMKYFPIRYVYYSTDSEIKREKMQDILRHTPYYSSWHRTTRITHKPYR